jgi:glycosyltransferase involved in cell wall biosynthesis
MKNILFFGTYFYPYLSGITTYPDQVLTALSKDHVIKVLCFKHQPNLANKEKRQGFQIIRMPYLFKLSKGFVSLRSWFYFWREAKQTEVLILNLPNAGGLPLVLISKLLGKKIIGIFHCQPRFDKGWWNKLIAGLLNTSLYLQMWLCEDLIAYTADYVHAQWAGKLFKNKFHYALPPVKKLAVDTIFLTELQQKKDDEIWIGFAGRVSREKGLTYLIQALHELQFQFQSKRSLRLVLAGPYGEAVAGESAYYNLVKDLLDEAGVKYCFLGSLSGGKLGAFYQAIDLLVLPSVNSTEAFGMVQAEAMLAGKSVIVSNLPGVRQLVMRTGMGLIVAPRDSQELSQAIEQIIQNPDKFQSPAKQLKVKQMFASQPTINLFKELLL